MKKLLSIILIAAIVLNVLFGALLVLDIRVFETPEISAEIDFLAYNTTALSLKTNLTIFNPNPFSMDIEEFSILTTTPDGFEISTITLKGGEVKSGETLSIVSFDDLSFPNIELVPLTHQISGVASVRFAGFITKSLPIKIDILTNFQNVLDNITVPIISLETNLTEINHDGVAYTGIIHITNPNSFAMSITEFDLAISNDLGSSVGHIDLEDITVDANGQTNTTVSGNLDFVALNADKLSFALTGLAGLTIGGINQSISFETEISLNIPEIDSLLNLHDDLEIVLSLDFRLGLLGLNNKVGFSIHNPTTIPLVLDDLVCTIYRVDGDAQTFIIDGPLSSCNVNPDETKCLSTELFINYVDFLTLGSGQLFPDAVKLNIHGYVGVKDVDQRLPISVSGIFDLNLLF